MSEEIKSGSIVLYIAGGGNSDTDMIYYYIGEVGTHAHDPNRWLVDFATRCFNCNESELVWLMDLPENKRGRNFRETLKEFQQEIFAAALRQLRQSKLHLQAFHDQAFVHAQAY